ncbi:unnamed protein product [Heligmosomoides polygyrus]|uniref:RAB3GAP2_C domain-containing protein n=1 Tax=Heligmosomoides polygyrus TaxID=6339 RepID=A0A183GMG3_HELPZ|nr:unnamed protein product [Heligmosomoides polygyrus]
MPYLDHAGAALPSEEQLKEVFDMALKIPLANPHSHHATGTTTNLMVADASFLGGLTATLWSWPSHLLSQSAVETIFFRIWTEEKQRWRAIDISECLTGHVESKLQISMQSQDSSDGFPLSYETL